MSTSYYIPDDDAGRVTWLNNFAGKINAYASILGIAAADVTQIQNDALDWKGMVSYINADKAHHHSAIAFKNHLGEGDKTNTTLGTLAVAPTPPVFSSTLQKDIFGRIAKYVALIKANKNYTSEIGKDLGLVAPGTSSGSQANTEKAATLKPLLTIKLNNGNRPYIRWHKGDTHLLRLMVDRNDGIGFTLLTIASHFSYIDNNPLPAINTSAIWKYKAVYLDSEENEIGEWSEISQITVTGV